MLFFRLLRRMFHRRFRHRLFLGENILGAEQPVSLMEMKGSLHGHESRQDKPPALYSACGKQAEDGICKAIQQQQAGAYPAS